MAVRCLQMCLIAPTRAAYYRYYWNSSLVLYCHNISVAERKYPLLQQQLSYGTVKVAESSMAYKLLHPISSIKERYTRKLQLTTTARMLYHQCVDKMDYESFFKALSMPDNFQSWFLVAHLHIWLCTLRLRDEGKEGTFVMHEMVRLFWRDAEQKMTALGVTEHQGKHLKVLDKKFRVLFRDYDIGVRTDRATLRTAIMDHMVDDKATCRRRSIDAVVKYIQIQHQKMVTTDSETLLNSGKMHLEQLSLRVL